jgi:hypothetical protein
VVGSIESHLFTPQNPALRFCARPTFLRLGVRPGLTRPLCWRYIANIMAECWVLTASHAGPVSARPCWPRAGVRANRRDPGQPRAFPRPVQRGHDDPPGQPCWNTWPGFPLPRLTDALQSGDHLVSAWPPGETPVESASQCDGAVGLPVPAVEPGISRLTLAGDRASSAGRTCWPQNTISQIPPNTATAPIRSVG